MTIRFLHSWVLMLVMMTGVISCSQNKSPNIIIVMADDLGYETISVNGGTSYKTPNIDKMAASGMRFEHCYSQPLCTPSRVKIMTGIYNVRNYVRFGYLDTTQTTFGHLCRDAGYATCIVGKWQLGKNPESPQQAGFEEHCLWQVTEGRIDSTGRDTRFSEPVLETNGELKTFEKNDYGPDVVSSYGMEFIERSVAEGRPFLLYYPMILTHCPFSPTPDSPEWMQDDTAVMKYKGQAHYFEDMMSYIDKIMGRIEQKLEALGIRENTIVIFTGDNGTDVPIVSMMDGREVAGAKSKSTDGGTRVPLIVDWPKKVKKGKVCSDLVDFSDFLPTICEAAGVDIPDALDLDGQSFYPQIVGKKGNPRRWIYNWYSRNGNVQNARVFARNHKYKLYSNGAYYAMSKDYLEQNPLLFDELDEEAIETHSMLRVVLEEYEKRRLEDVPEIE